MRQKIRYWIDQNDLICKVDDYWDNSLEDPTDQRIKSNEIIGKLLFDFICDDITRMFIKTLLQSVRLLKQPLCRPYRCDSPTEKRYMQMTIALEDNQLLSVTHEIIKTEPLVIPASFETVSCKKVTPQSSFHIRCSICNRLRLVGHKNWEEVDTLSDKDLKKQPIYVIYGVCFDCKGSLKNSA